MAVLGQINWGHELVNFIDFSIFLKFATQCVAQKIVIYIRGLLYLPLDNSVHIAVACIHTNNKVTSIFMDVFSR